MLKIQTLKRGFGKIQLGRKKSERREKVSHGIVDASILGPRVSGAASMR